MTVAELLAVLQQLPQDLPVCYTGIDDETVNVGEAVVGSHETSVWGGPEAGWESFAPGTWVRLG